MQLAIIAVFAVICELLALSSFHRGPMIQVTAQSGFVSIDCGGSYTNYTNAETRLFWITDSKGFGLENVSRAANVSLSPKYPTWTWLSSMRVFERMQNKYCYVFDQSYGIVQTNPYLVRASFWTGDTPPFSIPNKEQISFKLLINADEWDDIVISLPQKYPLVKEVYVVAALQTISVCVAGGGDTTFISSLELRPINNSWISVQEFMQAQDNAAPRAMFFYSRLDLGSSTGKDVRFPDDIYDRIWSADTSRRPTLSTTRYIQADYVDKPPSAVLQTALVDNSSFNITFDGFSGSYNFFYMLYFAEILDDVTAGERVFSENTITASGVKAFTNHIDLVSEGNGNAEYYNPNLIPVNEGGFLTFNFERASTSSFGPLVNALELRYLSRGPMSLGTYQSDVLALESIKASLQGFDSWRGDPCLPYSYEWLTCNLDIAPRITILSLQKKKIDGEIPRGISSLGALVELNLQGNNLSGSIPEFIAQLPNLTTLLLQDNNLSGKIPRALLDKWAKSALNFSIAGNPLLCKDENTTNCLRNWLDRVTYKGTYAAASKLGKMPFFLCGVAVLIVTAIIFSVHFLTKSANNHNFVITETEVTNYSNRAQHFTSQQIKRITNNFKTKLGSSGFGDVFFGVLSTGSNVAVKVSSLRDGGQGDPEFLNEVALLSRVNHKNVVELIGYCIESRPMLVYEYMTNGSLDDCLHGNAKVPLSWKDRLKIIVGAAEG